MEIISTSCVSFVLLKERSQDETFKLAPTKSRERYLLDVGLLWRGKVSSLQQDVYHQTSWYFLPSNKVYHFK